MHTYDVAHDKPKQFYRKIKSSKYAWLPTRRVVETDLITDGIIFAAASKLPHAITRYAYSI